MTTGSHDPTGDGAAVSAPVTRRGFDSAASSASPMTTPWASTSTAEEVMPDPTRSSADQITISEVFGPT